MTGTGTLDGKSNLAEDTEFWMTNLPEQLKNLPIIHLAIPGSHDSGTWTITRHSDFAPDLDDFLKKLQWLGIVIKTITCRWSKAQDYSIYEQLKVGVRYFDLRLSTKVSNNSREYYIVHGLYGPLISDVLQEFVKYLDEHPKEIVIFDCQHFYEFNDGDHDAFARMISYYFGKKIVPSTSSYIKHLTLNYMNENHYQVIVIYRRANAVQYNFFPSTAYPTPWPNTTSPDKLIEILSENLAGRNESVGYVSQFILTPVAQTVIFNLFTGNLKKFSGLKLHRKKFDWVKEQIPGSKGINVIIADFVDIFQGDFCHCVVNLNAKLLKDSERTTNLQGLPPVTN